jgi:hypothetical protein
MLCVIFFSATTRDPRHVTPLRATRLLLVCAVPLLHLCATFFISMFCGFVVCQPAVAGSMQFVIRTFEAPSL